MGWKILCGAASAFKNTPCSLGLSFFCPRKFTKRLTPCNYTILLFKAIPYLVSPSSLTFLADNGFDFIVAWCIQSVSRLRKHIQVQYNQGITMHLLRKKWKRTLEEFTDETGHCSPSTNICALKSQLSPIMVFWISCFYITHFTTRFPKNCLCLCWSIHGFGGIYSSFWYLYYYQWCGSLVDTKYISEFVDRDPSTFLTGSIKVWEMRIC
jgi:hypothetical protein